jgi:mannosyltransferase
MPMPVSLSMQPLPRQSVWGSPRAVTLIDFGLIFALALALRLHGLAAQPLWIDEVVTNSRVALPFSKLIAECFSHHHLPTYFLLLAQLSPGANPWLLRLPSAVAGAFAAAMGMLVGRKLAGSVRADRMGGLMSGLMLATAPVLVQFGQDARPYALELACVILSLWGLVVLACDAEAAGGSWRQGLGAWSTLWLGMVGALALIGDAVPFLLVANLSAWPIARSLAGAARGRFLLRWIGGQAAVVLAVAPLYVAMSRGIDDHFMAAFNWIPPLGAMRAWRVGANVYLLRAANIASLHLLPGGLPAPMEVGLGLAVPLFAGAGFVALRRQSAARIAMVLAVIALPAVLVLSEPARPLWLPRYLLWSGAAFLILAGVGAAWLVRGYRVAASAVAAALLLVNLLPFYRAETVPRWDLAAAALAPALAAGADVFLDYPGVSMMLRAYLPGGNAALPDDRVLFRISEAEARLRAGAPIIAIHGPIGQELTSRRSAFRVRVGQLGTPDEETRIGREIVLIRFNPTPGRTSSRSEANVRPIP